MRPVRQTHHCMNTPQTIKHTYFTMAKIRLTKLAERLVAEDAPAVVAEAESIFDAMLPGMAYLDKPDHPMAPALFICNVNLAMYLALKKRGINVDDFGRSLLTGIKRAPIQPRPMTPEGLVQFATLAKDSQANPQPGEDVIEMVAVDPAKYDYGFNVHSCAISQSAAKHDAMEVVPYMCAVDDVMSEKGNQGLQRTGSIALGASHCDFRYKSGGEPRPLAEQYPNRIQLPVL